MKAPDWLAEWQARFGDAIRTPLDRTTGTLRSREANEGVAVYNRQYWFRLFGVFQRAYPLTARLFGHWHFNAVVSDFLVENPPHDHDIERATDGFDAWLAPSARPIVVEAARIDAAHLRVFSAPEATPWRPSPSEGEALLDAKLVISRSVAWIEERWPLLDLRRALLHDDGETAVEEPLPYEAPRAWALVGRSDGVLRFPLEPLERRLFELLSAHTVGDALARLEAECPEAERTSLPGKTREWLARSVTLGFFRGLSREGRS